MPVYRPGGGAGKTGERQWWCYVCQCNDGTLYTGIALNVSQRIAQHNEGKGAKYTRSRRPVTLRYKEQVGSLSAALKREVEIKGMRRWEKELLGCF